MLEDLEEGKDKMLKFYGDSDGKNHWKQGNHFRRENIKSLTVGWLKGSDYKTKSLYIDPFAGQATNHET